MNVVDTIAPEITLLGDPVIFVEMNTTYTDDGATASDLCDGSLTASIVTVNPVDTSIPDTYIVTYNVADASGNNAVEVTRTVIVPDTSQPDIVLVDVETALTVLVTYNKNMDGGLGMDVAASYTVSGSGIGTFSANPDSVERVSGTVYRLIWTRPDEMLNGGDIVITVDPNVEDSAGNFMRDNVGEDLGGAIGEAPVITMNGADETLECNVDTFTEPGASAADNVDGSVPVIITGDDLGTPPSQAPTLFPMTLKMPRAMPQRSRAPLRLPIPAVRLLNCSAPRRCSLNATWRIMRKSVRRQRMPAKAT